MPELPEVETVVRDLNKKVKGAKIVGVWFDWPKLIKDIDNQKRSEVSSKAVAGFKKDLIGVRILSARRKAKTILIDLTGGKTILIHQKMTGHLLVGRWRIKGKEVIGLEPEEVVKDPYNSYIRLIFYFEDGRMLALSDLRRFAKVILGPTEKIDKLAELVRLGPDALVVSERSFIKILKKQKRKIKTVLLDQNVISGIGNIYSDEMLYLARIHPERVVGSLSLTELKNLYRAGVKILSKAVALRGTSSSDFRDTAGKKGGYTKVRLVYQKEGMACGRCQSSIERIKVGGRSAHYCPKCQAK